MPLASSNNLDEHDKKKRVLSNLIFQAISGTYMEDHAQAKFLYSIHYKINSTFSNQGGILGCFSVGPYVLSTWTKEDAYATITQSLHPNSMEAKRDKDVRV